MVEEQDTPITNHTAQGVGNGYGGEEGGGGGHGGGGGGSGGEG